MAQCLTPRKYIEAWQKVLQVFAADFPNQYVSLSLGFGLNINDRGKLDAREREFGGDDRTRAFVSPPRRALRTGAERGCRGPRSGQVNGNAPTTVLQVPAGEIRIFRNVEDLSNAAAYMFMDGAVEAVKDHGQFAVALSGGSTPRKLYAMLAEPDFARRIPWNRVHLFWGDERCVPPDDPESNYGMVQEALLRKISIPATNVYRIRGEIPPEQAATEYDTWLREFFGVAGHGLPRFDLVLLGLGEDGHTASLFPDSPALDECERLAVASHVELLDAHRVSLTLPVFNHSAAIAFLVAGERKRSAVARVMRHPNENGELPAQRVRPVDGKLLWFLDEPAAAGIL